MQDFFTDYPANEIFMLKARFYETRNI